MRKRLLYEGGGRLSVKMRPRQRMSYRLAFYVAGSLLVAFTLGLFFYFQFSHSERGYATTKEELKKNFQLRGAVFNSDLVIFTAYVEKDMVKLAWKTASECNNDFFT